MLINPHLELRLSKDDDQGIRAIVVHAPVRGEGLKITTVDPDSDPDVFSLLLTYSATRGAMGLGPGLSAHEEQKLVELGVLIDEARVAQQVLFECDVNGASHDLVPRRAVRRPRVSKEPLVVHPSFQVLPEGGPTADMRGRFRLANPFRTDRTWVSIDDRASSPSFYSMPLEWRARLAGLQPGAPPPDSLPSDMLTTLVDAGVLCTTDDLHVRAAAREHAVDARHATLTGSRWVLVDEVIPPMQIAAIRRYYRDLIAQGFIRYEDPEWPHRYFASREPLTYFYQQQLTGLMSAIVGEPVKPSFSFLASYRPGAELKPHRDREQCYYAMSVLLDHAQDDDVSDWPLFMKPPGATEAAAVRCGLGDGLLYFGEEVVHYRHPLSTGYSTLWFMFWVPVDYEGSLD